MAKAITIFVSEAESESVLQDLRDAGWMLVYTVEDVENI